MSAPSSPAAARSASREPSPSLSSEALEINSSGPEVRDNGDEIKSSTKESPDNEQIVKTTDDHTMLEHSRSPSLLVKNDTDDVPAQGIVAEDDTDLAPSITSSPIEEGSDELPTGDAVPEQVAEAEALVENDDPEVPLRGAATASDTASPPDEASPARANHTALDAFEYLFDDGEDEDDNWQPQSHGLDVPQRSSKRKSRATADEDEDPPLEDEEEVVPAPKVVRKKKKPKVVADLATEVDEEAPVVPRNAKPSPPSKRKRRTKQDDDQPDEDEVEEKTVKKKKKKSGDPAKTELDRLERLEEARLAKAPLPQIAKLNRATTMKVKKGYAQIVDRIDEVNELAKQITSVPPSRLPDLITKFDDRDENGLKTKAYYEKIRQPIKEREIGGWKGSKWVDEEDDNITWFKIPAKQKYLSLSGRMVPVADIVAKSPLLPEFRFVENVFTEDPKTGKEVVGFHVVMYERMPLEEKNERMKALVARDKMRKKQEAKDAAAAARRKTKGRGRR